MIWVALHPEGVDRNAYDKEQAHKSQVALHPEGVDRNKMRREWLADDFVALHPEGVDRNLWRAYFVKGAKASPSTRRAWIEIIYE